MKLFPDGFGEGDVGILGGLVIDERLFPMFFEGEMGIDEIPIVEISWEEDGEEK